MKSTDPCPCGSQNTREKCCQRFINGDHNAPTPELLMRSRYTAFTLNDYDYLKKTWHPGTCPADFSDGSHLQWIELEVIKASPADSDKGEVEFKAKYIHNNQLEVIHENSRFEKIAGRWLYVSGDFKGDNDNKTTLTKNSPCPCGSGKKYKRCHYQG